MFLSGKKNDANRRAVIFIYHYIVTDRLSEREKPALYVLISLKRAGLSAKAISLTVVVCGFIRFSDGLAIFVVIADVSRTTRAQKGRAVS